MSDFDQKEYNKKILEQLEEKDIFGTGNLFEMMKSMKRVTRGDLKGNIVMEIVLPIDVCPEGKYLPKPEEWYAIPLVLWLKEREGNE